MLGGVKTAVNGGGFTYEGYSLLEIDVVTFHRTFNFKVSEVLTMWNQGGDNGGDNTLSVLNGWANVGGLWCGNSGKNFVNIRDGHLDVGYFTSAKVTVTMLAGGKGEFKLADLRCGTSNSGCNFKNKASPRCPIAFCSWKANIPLCYKIDRLIEITLCATFNTIKSFRASYFPTSVALLFFSFWPPNEGLLNV